MSALHHIPVPRFVHGPDGERLVSNHRELEQALSEGFGLSPILSDEQKAAVKAAQIAAGEIEADEADEPKADEKPKSKKSKKADEPAE